MNQINMLIFANMKINSTIEKMAQSGYIMQSDVANNAAITDTPCAPVGMVLICGTLYVPYFAA
jgi:hypothetical protein